MNPLQHSWVLAVLGGLGLVAFASLWFVNGQIGAPAQVVGVLGALCLVGYAAVDRERLAAGASTREALAGASAILVLTLALIIGILGVALLREHDVTQDVTRDGRYTLSSRTVAVLAGLDAPVTLYGLFQEGSPTRKDIDRLAGQYAAASDNVTYQAIDPVMEPAKARAVIQTTGNSEMDRLSEGGTLILTSGSRRSRIESRFDETAITNALVKLTSGQDHRVCWSIGHGEADADDDQSPTGYGGLVLRLEDRNVVVTEQRILTEGVDPACEALVIAAPRADFEARELEAVAAYVGSGGQVVLLLDTPLLETERTPRLVADLERYGIAVGDDVILENDAAHVTTDATGEPLMLYATPEFKLHPIVSTLPTGIAVRWPRSVQATDQAVGIEVRELVSSTAQSWADKTFDPNAETPPQPDEGEQLGPVPFVVLAQVQDPDALEVQWSAAPPSEPEPEGLDTDRAPYEGPAVLHARSSLVPDDLVLQPGGRVFVVGDADLGSNALSTLLDNGDLVLNAISFLLDEGDQVGVDSDEGEYLTLSDAQLALLFLIGVLLIPGAAVVVGTTLLVRRRFL